MTKREYCNRCDELVDDCMCNFRIKARDKVKQKKMKSDERVFKKKTKRREDKVSSAELYQGLY